MCSFFAYVGACHSRNHIIPEEEIHLYHIDSYSDSGDDFDKKCVPEIYENKSDSTDSELNTDTAAVQLVPM